MVTHRARDGAWDSCTDPTTCPSPLHLDMDIAEAETLPVPFVELLAEVVDPANRGNHRARWWCDENGETHRDYDLPAMIGDDGRRSWHQEGKLHREDDKPAVVEITGSLYWYKHNRQHRDGGQPAIIHPDGSQCWFVDGQRHRVGGPAVIDADGAMEWWERDVFIKRLRADGTLIVNPKPSPTEPD